MENLLLAETETAEVPIRDRVRARDRAADLTVALGRAETVIRVVTVTAALVRVAAVLMEIVTVIRGVLADREISSNVRDKTKALHRKLRLKMQKSTTVKKSAASARRKISVPKRITCMKRKRT